MNIHNLPTPPTWMSDALCAEIADDGIFFPEGGSVAAAKRICRACAVTLDCLNYALEFESGARGPVPTHPSGVFGGLSAHERRDLKRENKSA